MANRANILARYRHEAGMANRANILARCRHEADTNSVEAGRNLATPNREDTATGRVETGAAVIGIRTPPRAGAFLTHLTTAIILMGITLCTGTDLVIPFTGVRTHIGAGAFLTCTRTTAFILTGIILRIGTFMTIAPYREGDSFDTWRAGYPV
jgi:hypothetical protein